MNKIYWIVILALIVIIVLQGSCQKAPVVSEPSVIVKTEIIYDTIEKNVPVYIPKWYSKTEVRIDTIKEIDTLKVLGDYYAIYFYSDSLISDSLKLFIKDSVSQNKIQSRKIDYSLVYPTKIITKETSINRREFYIGLGLNTTSNSIGFLGPELMYRSRKKTAYSLGVGINNDLKTVIGFRIYRKL